LMQRRLTELSELLQKKGELKELPSPESPKRLMANMDESTGSIERMLKELRGETAELDLEGKLDPELRKELSNVIRVAGAMHSKMQDVVRHEVRLEMAEDQVLNQDTIDITVVVQARSENMKFNQGVEELDVIMREIRQETTGFDTKVVPNKRKWWRYRWEYSFVEAVILMILCMLAILWEAIHWRIRDFIYAKAASTPTFNPDYWDNSLIILWSRFFFGELWVILMVYISLWFMDRIGAWRLWLPVSWHIFVGMNLPTEARIYTAMSMTIAMQLAIGMMIFFALMLMVVIIANHCEVHFKKLEDGTEDDTRDSCSLEAEDRAHHQALRATAEGYAMNVDEYGMLRTYFEGTVEPHLMEQFGEEGQNEQHPQFMLWYFISLKVKSGVSDTFRIRVLTWVAFLLVFGTFAFMHRVFHAEYVSLTLFLFVLFCVPLGWMMVTANDECKMLRDDIFNAMHSRRFFTTEQPRSPRHVQTKSVQGRRNVHVYFVNLFQASCFFLCYSAARIIFSPWMIEFFFVTTLLISIGFLVFIFVFRVFIATTLVKYFIALALPPHITDQDKHLMKETRQEAKRRKDIAKVALN